MLDDIGKRLCGGRAEILQYEYSYYCPYEDVSIFDCAYSGVEVYPIIEFGEILYRKLCYYRHIEL